MKRLILRHYLSRFGLEILLFWLICLSNSVVYFMNGPHALQSLLSMMEVLGWVWLTVRLLLAEDGLRMSGGWRARPVPPRAQRTIPVLLLLTVVAVPVGLRILMLRGLFAATARDWMMLWRESWLSQWIGWFALAACVALYGRTILRQIDGRARIAAWLVIACLLLPGTALMMASFRHAGSRFWNGGSDRLGPLAPGIRAQLGDAANLVGPWNDPVRPHEMVGVREVLRIASNHSQPADGVRIRSFQPAVSGERVRTRLIISATDRRIVERLRRASMVLRYADETFGAAHTAYHRVGEGTLPAAFVHQIEIWGEFASPLSLPEFEGSPAAVLTNLELRFYEFDPRAPMPDAGWQENGLNFPFEPDSMKELFTRFPWTDPTWKEVAQPFLTRHANREHLPMLLDHLRTDLRLLPLLLEKGWGDEAVVVLRELAKERLPLSVEGILLLAAESDATLADDLAVLALQHVVGLGAIEEALRPHPGFDWPAFAREAWRRCKYRTNWLEPSGECWLIALWAAREGDESAFLEIASQAARGKVWETGQLRKLIEGEPEDPVALVRKHATELKFNPATRSWGW